MRAHMHLFQCRHHWFQGQTHVCPSVDTCVFQGQTHVCASQAQALVCQRADLWRANACKDNLLTKPRLHMLTNPTVYSTSWHRHVDNNPRAHRTRIRGICAHTCLHVYVDMCARANVQFHMRMCLKGGETHARAHVPSVDTCVVQAQALVCRRADTFVRANAYKENILN